MPKRVVLSSIAIFVVWGIMDFVIHGVILQSTYALTVGVFRPQAEMDLGLIYLVTLISAVSFSAIYGYLITPKSIANAILFGLLFGLAAGVSMGIGSFATLMIPFRMGLTWFLGVLAEAIVGGILVAWLIPSAESRPS